MPTHAAAPPWAILRAIVLAMLLLLVGSGEPATLNASNCVDDFKRVEFSTLD